jgi:hypothetical protein
MALNGIRYAQMNDLVTTRHLAELGWRPRAPFRVALGYDRWNLESNDPSWFDVWPFNVWDIFTATRYRLDSASHTWDVGYVRFTWTPASQRPLSFGLDGRLEWWGDDGRLLWKKRVPTLAPFFFRFDHKSDSLDWSFTHGTQVDSWIEWRTGSRAHLRLDGQLVFPWGKRNGAAKPATESAGEAPVDAEQAEDRRGGLRLRLSAGVDW